MKLFVFEADNKTIHATSHDTTVEFELNPMDIEFIEEDIIETGAKNGSIDCIVDEGLIYVYWEVKEEDNGTE